MIPPQLISFSPLGVTILFLIAAIWCRFVNAERAGTVSASITTIASLTTIIAIVLYSMAGVVTTPAIGGGFLTFSSQLDPLNLIALSVVVFVGFVVVRFSRHYLDGNPRQATFFAQLNLTLAAVSFLVTSGSLAQVVAGWIVTSFALHRLLLFYPDRPLAVVAARKKFWIARLGDVCLAGGVLMIWQATSATSISEINALARAGAIESLPVATLLIAIAALLKCAQFPTHGWLTEVMETPTPVSALLHAGIVNGGGYLIIRFADVVVLSTGTLMLLVVVGGVSALFASLCMLTQTSIKRTLAYSTIAQMGFMMLQCGLGAFASAALHLVAHSVYKAHSFLASGDTVEHVRLRRMADSVAKPVSATTIALATLLALAIYASLAATFNLLVDFPEGVIALGATFVLGLAAFLSRGLQGRDVVLRTSLNAILSTTVYFGLQALMIQLFTGQLPAAVSLSGATLVITALLLIGFAIVSWLQFIAPRTQSRWFKRLYVALRNGLYINDFSNRFAGVYRRVSE
ncbi:MAG: proton-conducting transporter membrane subunit [Pseudomonadota bacterium]